MISQETTVDHLRLWNQMLLCSYMKPSSMIRTRKSIVSDNDSTMRAHLKHPGNHKRGKLNPEIPKPSWLADPSHRTKVVAKYMFNLATLPKSKSTCTKIDAVRVKKYFGYMLKTNRDRTIPEIKIASLAVIEHLFDNHQYCDSRWCRPKKNQQ